MTTITQQLADALRVVAAGNTNQEDLQEIAREALAAYDAQQTAGVAEGWKLVPAVPTEKMLRAGVAAGVGASPEPWCPKTWAAMLAAAPAASGGEDKGDPVCREDDGCPTEGAVLKRFWRAVNTDDTKQLMAFYGVADVPALIEQQVQHVQSLQIKLKAHEPKRDQFPKSPREG